MKRNRPWDKRHRLVPTEKKKANSSDIPFVEIRGQKFYSDRFYLNTSILDDAVPKRTTTANATADRDEIHPHAPLFDRSAWIQSFFNENDSSKPKVQAIVFGTYTVDWRTLIQEFPSVFAESSRIPCLVLYGKKNWSDDSLEMEQPSDRRTQLPGCDASLDEEEDFDDDKTIASVPSVATQDAAVTLDLPSAPTAAPQFPKMVHFSQVTSSWWNRTAAASSLSWKDIIDPSTGYLQSHVIDERQSIPHGVHHSKYILLFLADGSLAVSVSTANLTQPTTTDATWIQRFPPATAFSVSPQGLNSDFGRVLTHYLQVTMLSAAANQVTLHWFVQNYLDWKSVGDLSRRFDFRAAQVDLVAVVPGEYNARCFNNESAVGDLRADSAAAVPHRFLYGQERISSLVQQLRASVSLKYQNFLYSEKDRLIVQPTSFGGGWNLSNMSDLIRSYLGTAKTDHDAMQQLDIVWPCDNLIAEINRKFSYDSSDDKDGPLQSTKEKYGGFLFMSSESFNRVDFNCLNRMVLFEPSIPPQRPAVLTPHFKCVARLINNPDGIRNHIISVKKDANGEAYFSWFLLTSACLSRGAQGAHIQRTSIPDVRQEETAYSYTNFEMGVLFGSRVSSVGKSACENRLYCWNPNPGSSNPPPNTTREPPRLIHLPVPFRTVNPRRYVPDEEVALFCETPFFHEIVPGTGCEGNMQLTPYGMALAKQCHYEND
jgi:Tyrosyl-DNA phosphodiesterase